ncbi:MAG: T9SS type A sorting domain-containing protein [Bacteroidia bacterium]|nr:T9SS type A sorting domain-containing protein [Bacteroidia bacterium]
MTTGSNLSSVSVNKTWEIGKTNRPGLDEVEIVLQHLNDDEGVLFKLNRQKSYISQYNSSVWDTGIIQKSPEVGYLTSRGFMPNSGRNLMLNSGVNSRVFNNSIVSPSYFTKFTGYGDTSNKTKLWFYGNRLDASLVRVFWVTSPEYYINYFVVQRRLSNETDFKDIDTLSSLAINGFSLDLHEYNIIDTNSYTGISFYRLKIFNYYTTISYSNIVAVPGKATDSPNVIWPNPTTDRFSVGLNHPWVVKTIIIWNLFGQKIHEENVNGRSIIEMGGLIPGSYFVGLIDDKGKIIETKKLIVVGK